jgi:long-chain acyl-CoA synthetase
MATFLENVLAQLQRSADRVIVREIRGSEFMSVTGTELLELVARARGYLRNAGLQAGDHCALLGANSIRWVAIDIALMAEGIVVVPLYSRQAPAELAAMMQDCLPKLLLCGESALGDAVAQVWVQAPPRVTFDEILRENAGAKAVSGAPNPRADADLVTIIYTSGTSGEPKGVCLTSGNLNHMLASTTGWMDRLGYSGREAMRVFQYLPFNFAASWIVVMSCLSKDTVLTLSTDLNKLAAEIRLSAPNYFFNVPTLLERVRRGVEEALGKRPGIIQRIYRNATDAWQRKHAGKRRGGDTFKLFLGQKLIFRNIRDRFGTNLRGLVCGSAPLAPETQDFFTMLGIPIWQVYGLTETCGICTMDDPARPGESGRVGQAIPGIEMKAGDNEEILVRGPNIFPGYWNRPEDTARVLRDGWFHSGDQGEMNLRGNWRISGRIKNLLVLNSAHKVAPEPLEEKIAQGLPGAQQVVIVGNGRGYLCALITGTVDAKAVRDALDELNMQVPHYRQIRNFVILPEAFTPESGLVTANGKLRRDVINEKFREEIEQMYAKQAVAASGNG